MASASTRACTGCRRSDSDRPPRSMRSGELCHHSLRQRGQIHARRRRKVKFARIQPRQRQHAVDHPRGAIDAGDQRLQCFAALLLVVRAQRHLRLRPQSRQWRAQFVGGVRGQCAFVQQCCIYAAQQAVDGRGHRAQFLRQSVTCKFRGCARRMLIDGFRVAHDRRSDLAHNGVNAERQRQRQHHARQQQAHCGRARHPGTFAERLGDVDTQFPVRKGERVDAKIDRIDAALRQTCPLAIAQARARTAGRSEQHAIARIADMEVQALAVCVVDRFEFDLDAILTIVVHFMRDHRQHGMGSLDQRRVEHAFRFDQHAAIQPGPAQCPDHQGRQRDQRDQSIAQRPDPVHASRSNFVDTR